MCSVRTSKLLPSFPAVLCTAALALSGFGCEKSPSSKDDRAEAESPAESASADSGGSAKEEQEKQVQLKSELPNEEKMKPDGGRADKMPKKGDGIEVTDEDLENFARVQIRMQKYAESQGLMDERPQGKKAKIEMMMKMKQKADSVMDDIGMDQRRYAEIGREMRANTELKKRLNQKIQELKGAEGEETDGTESGEESGGE